jgi:hypothetical protein
VTIGKGIEATGRFGAARNEYRLARALDPQNAEANAGYERCTNEAKAATLLEQAKMEIVRLRLDHALELIEEGEGLTTIQKDMFEGARAQVEQSRFEVKYQAALAMERDFQYEKAIAQYEELLGETEYYKDAIARKQTLQEYVRLAAELYAKAQSASTDEERLESLRRIRVFWPEYKDVSAQLERLEKAGQPPTKEDAAPRDGARHL